jgi:hypothetical protein
MSDFRYFTTALYQSGSTPNPIIAELPLTAVSFDTQLNSIGSFTGELLLSGLDAAKLNILQGTNPGQTCLYVDYGGTIIWGGIIWMREYDSETQILRITGQEMLSYFKRRKITPLNTTYYNSGSTTPTSITYSNSDPCVVANDLIVNYAQSVTFPSQGNTVAGNIGLQPSSTTSSYKITRTYFDYELKEVFQAVKDLSDGLDSSAATPFFDFTITYTYNSSGRPVKHFTMGSPYMNGTTYTSVFQFPGNLVEYTYNQDGTNTVNALWGLGYGKNANKVIALALDNKYTNQGSINATNGNAAILEDTASFIDIEDTNLLGAVNLGQLNARTGITVANVPTSGSPIVSAPEVVQVVLPPYVDPYLGTYNAGDFARLIIIDDLFPSGYDYNAWRIVSISVEPGEDKESRVTISLSRAIYNLGSAWVVAL